MYAFLFILFVAVCAIVAFYATFIHSHQHSDTQSSVDKGGQKPKHTNITTTPPPSSDQPRTPIVTPAHSAANSNTAVAKPEAQKLQHFCIKTKTITSVSGQRIKASKDWTILSLPLQASPTANMLTVTLASLTPPWNPTHPTPTTHKPLRYLPAMATA